MISMRFIFVTFLISLHLLNVQSGCITVNEGDSFDIAILMQSDVDSDECSETMAYLASLVDSMKNVELEDDGANPPADIRVGLYIASNGLESIFRLGGPANDGSNMNQMPVTQDDIDSAVTQIASNTNCGSVSADTVDLTIDLEELLGDTLVPGATRSRYQRIVIYVSDAADLSEDEKGLMADIRNNGTSDIYDVYVLDDNKRDRGKAICTKAMYRSVSSSSIFSFPFPLELPQTDPDSILFYILLASIISLICNVSYCAMTRCCKQNKVESQQTEKYSIVGKELDDEV